MGAHRAEMKLPTAALLVCCLCVSAVPLSYEESSVEDLIDEPPAGTGSDAGTAEEPPEGAALDTSEAGLKKAATANAVRDWWIAYTSDKSFACFCAKRCAAAAWIDCWRLMCPCPRAVRCRQSLHA